VAILTLTPALLRLTGRWAFWPAKQLVPALEKGRSPLPGPQERGPSEDRFHRLWERIAESVLRRPGTYWLASTAVLVPFAVVGALWYNHLSYDLVGNLPQGAVSVAGTQVLEQHFPAGATGPVNLLIRMASKRSRR
jgi:RND superfamily putative drug exporter